MARLWIFFKVNLTEFSVGVYVGCEKMKGIKQRVA